jgi:pimeloyl-ACP methyl ester carboxylesterase
MATVDIEGHATWFEDRAGPGVPVLLLHGGMSNSDALLGSIASVIGQQHRVVAFDRRGHGRTADTDRPFHYDAMADETIAFLESVVAEPAHLVGWSDGGIVALLVALRRPELVERLVLIGVNYHFSGILELDIDPDGEFAQFMFTDYAERSPDGPEHFPVVVDKAITLFATEPTLTTTDIATVTAPALVLVGDDDLIVPHHTQSLYEALPAGQLCVIPGASHGAPMEKPALVAHLIVEFLDGPVPPTTLIPNRRKPG